MGAVRLATKGSVVWLEGTDTKLHACVATTTVCGSWDSSHCPPCWVGNGSGVCHCHMCPSSHFRVAWAAHVRPPFKNTSNQVHLVALFSSMPAPSPSPR